MQPEKFKLWSAKKGKIINAGKHFKCAIYNHFYFGQIKSEWNFIKNKIQIENRLFSCFSLALDNLPGKLFNQAVCRRQKVEAVKSTIEQHDQLETRSGRWNKLLWITRKKN